MDRARGAAFTQGLVDADNLLAALSIGMVGAKLDVVGGVLQLVGSPPPLTSLLDPVLDAALPASVEGPYVGLREYERGNDHDVAIGMGVLGSLVNEWPDRFYHS
ncbi:MAG TPA: hypothetical protein EYP33_03785, partial [Pyrodictium sp.]|nr:hypothetical protein [Pyrodictium sp.]